MTTHGFFPFGQPNAERPMRVPIGSAKAIVVGVYPSAFHVAWSAPGEADVPASTHRSRPTIGSLAVDVEPVVFWDGVEPSPGSVLEQWKSAVGFQPSWGKVTAGLNGPSGDSVVTNTLGPLGLEASEVAFTDAVPWYFVKQGGGSQGKAIRERFQPVAELLGVSSGSLPTRPSTQELVRTACEEPRRSSLRAEIVTADVPLLITLGNEALHAVRGVSDKCSGVQEQLEPLREYGSRGQITIAGRSMQMLPLVHPGFQRQTKNAEWRAAIARWTSEASR